MNDPDISSLLEEFGGDGYLVFFGVLELMSKEFDENNPGVSTFSYRFLTKNLQISRGKLTKILQKTTEKERIFASFSDNKITLKCEKLEELCDNWTQSKLRSNLEVKKKKLNSKDKEVDIELKKEVESNKEKDIEKEKLSLPEYHTDDYQKIKKEAIEILEYLNKKAGKNYPQNYFGFNEILQRLHEGRLKEQFTAIIDKKIKDPGFSKNYLRPETLFSEQNFDKYLYENEDYYGVEGQKGSTGKERTDLRPPSERGLHIGDGRPFPVDFEVNG